MHLWDTPDEAVKSYRERMDWELEDSRVPGWENPGPTIPVDAARFLAGLDVAAPGVLDVLVACYPAARFNAGMMHKAGTRLRFWAWTALKGHNNLHSGYQALLVNADAQRLLGFEGRLPCYETLRRFAYELLTPDRAKALKTAILQDMKRLAPDLGKRQVQDCTPHEALRRDEAAPYNPHYKVAMHRLELRWDPDREALLADQFFNGIAHENQWANHLTNRLVKVGLRPESLTTDNGYSGFHNQAHHWRLGIKLIHKAQDSWVIDVEAAGREVERRYKQHWHHRDWHRNAPWERKLRLLHDHGSNQDREAVGRWLRDHELTHRPQGQEAQRQQLRAQNEGLNAELKRLPLRPQRQGALWQLRRVLACTLTLALVQWNRLLHGATKNLCRTAYIV